MSKVKIVLEGGLRKRQIKAKRAAWKPKIKRHLRNKIKSKSYFTRDGKLRYELYVIARIPAECLEGERR